MIMWDSRTAHCSAPALEDTQASGLLRMASLVCMMPRRLAPEDVIERRKQAPLDVTSTTNWSDRWINADEFPQLLVEQDLEKYPHTDGFQFRRPEPPSLTRRQLELVGYSAEEVEAGAYPYVAPTPRL